MVKLYTQEGSLQGQYVNSTDICSILQEQKMATAGFTLEEMDSRLREEHPLP